MRAPKTGDLEMHHECVMHYVLRTLPGWDARHCAAFDSSAFTGASLEDSMLSHKHKTVGSDVRIDKRSIVRQLTRRMLRS